MEEMVDDLPLSATIRGALLGEQNGARLVLASRRIENHWNYEDIMMALRLAAPEHQWDRAAAIMQAELEDCLTGRGYVKFKLTDGQYKRLRKLDQGSVDRRRYLHSLASDPDVLAAQAIAES